MITNIIKKIITILINESFSRINCSVPGCFAGKSRWCLIELVCQGCKVYSALSNPEDWILRCIRNYLPILINNNNNSNTVEYVCFVNWQYLVYLYSI